MEILYNIIIYPLVQIIEFVFVFAQKTFKETGVSILAVSGAVSVLCLPLYNVAEKWQRIERDVHRKLKPKIDKIKAVFSGDEEYMMLSVYYRQNHYHPVYAMRNTASLLIQIPFFIAAYSYLSHLEILKDARFLFISDLGAPDGLLKTGIGDINLLPVLMTAVNIASGAVYTKGLAARDKVQLYGMAAIFLVLLYNSPAGLVLYWTCNNIFSLAKNCAVKTGHSKKILYALFFIVILITTIYLILFHSARSSKRIPVIIVLTAFLLLMVFIKYIEKAVKKFIGVMDSGVGGIAITKTFLHSAVILFLLSGLVIPAALIASSAGEFSFIEPYNSPFPFIGATLLQGAGFFLFWFPVIYFFFSKNVKIMLSILISIVSTAAVINTFIFPGDYGFLTTSLVFSNVKGFGFRPMLFLFNVFVITAAGLCMILALAKNKTVFHSVQMILIITLTVFGISRLVKIEIDFRNIASGKKDFAADSAGVLKPVYHLSKNGKNVIFIMLDRGISGYVPYIFEERPDLRGSFRGFTWYPNCVSLGGGTLLGLPPLFGGYEYSPDKVQKRNRKLVETWNESLLVLPRLFSETGFHVTVTDPSYANFINGGDLRIYDGYSNVHAENLHNRFVSYWIINHPDVKLLALSGMLKNNLMRFSFFKMAPVSFREILYNNGDWMVVNKFEFTFGNSGINYLTLDNYSMLDMLPKITKVDNIDVNTYTSITNDLTHEPAFFQAPDYIPSNNITNFGSSPFADEDAYHANMAALILLGKWFDYLKQQGVYDNSRIIISADHGWPYNTKLPNFTLPDGNSLIAVSPLLLVKDFKDYAAEETGGIKTDHAFMSHADVPYLASRDITTAVNPFTGNSLFYDKTGGITITTHHNWEGLDSNKRKWNIPSGKWLHVHDDIFDPANWKRVE